MSINTKTGINDNMHINPTPVAHYCHSLNLKIERFSIYTQARLYHLFTKSKDTCTYLVLRYRNIKSKFSGILSLQKAVTTKPATSETAR